MRRGYGDRAGRVSQNSIVIRRAGAADPGDLVRTSLFGVVGRAAGHVVGNLSGDLSTSALAAAAGVSERHLTRLFIGELGLTPGRFVRNARTEAAAQLLVSGSLPAAGIAARCGFGSAETLRQAFVSRYGTPPSRYRAMHGASC